MTSKSIITYVMCIIFTFAKCVQDSLSIWHEMHLTFVGNAFDILCEMHLTCVGNAFDILCEMHLTCVGNALDILCAMIVRIVYITHISLNNIIVVVTTISPGCIILISICT